MLIGLKFVQTLRKESMKRTFIEAIEHRRSHYSLSAAMAVNYQEIVRCIERIILATPSAYNSQSSRIVVLFGIHHLCLWGIVKQCIKNIVSPDVYTISREKIDNCFASGCGTVLFYEDTKVVEQMKVEYQSYADKFDTYSAHTSAMHQFAIWTALEDMGFGASLQHYNPLIDNLVAEQWDIDKSWQLIAQMPFGTPLDTPKAKEQIQPLSERYLVFYDDL